MDNTRPLDILLQTSSEINMFENMIHLWEGSGGGQLCTSLIYSTKKSLMLEKWNTLGPLWHVDSGLLQLKND